MKRFMRLFIVLVIVGAIQLPCGGQEWISLFNGESLKGWKASENPDSIKVEDGVILCDGPRAHLFYTGDVQNADFKNFELKVEVKTEPEANSGVYFHTEYQEEGYPAKGYEIQVNNTYVGHGNYHELKKTGSLYGVRNLYKTIAEDNEWFTIHAIVRDKRVQIFVNGTKTVDYVEPDEPVRGENNKGRVLSHGTFALQGHDPLSIVRYRDIRVKILPDDLKTPESMMPTVDETYKTISILNERNFPIIDSHVHLKGTLTLQDALEKSRRSGIFYGIAPNCGVGFPITDDAGIYEFVKKMQGQPIFLGMQAEGREWVDTFSNDAISQFDYVFSDALTFFDDEGNRVRLWIKEEVEVKDKQDFMEMYVDRILSVLNDEPIDIFVNPTFLPEVIADEYDELWTEERMQKVIDAAVKNRVAIEINDRYQIPSKTFIQLGKKAGLKFSFGTNNGDENFGRLEYCLKMMKECNLTGQDMFLP